MLQVNLGAEGFSVEQRLDAPAQRDLAAPWRNRLLDRAQRIIHIPQFVLGRHPLERPLDLAIAAKILLAIHRVLHLPPMIAER